MNREDIIRMAREADLQAEYDDYVLERLERFAALVAKHTLANIDPSSFMSWQEGYEAGAAAEREKVAAWMIQRSYATGHGDTIEDLLVELEWQVRESEREACAKVCESMRPSEQEFDQRFYTACTLNANAIRARGNT